MKTSQNKTTTRRHRVLTVISSIILALGVTLGTDVYAGDVNNNTASADAKVQLGTVDIDVLRTMMPNEAVETYKILNKALIDYVNAEIAKEKGKKTDQFFVIQKCLKPCLKSPFTCYSDLDDIYHESVYKLFRAIAALFVHTNDFSKHPEYLSPRTIAMASVLYNMAAQKRNHLNYFNINYNDDIAQFYRGKFTVSPVGTEILYSPLDENTKQRLIGIWYFRQVHYAVESLLSDMGIPKTNYKSTIELLENGVLSAILPFITYDSMPANIDWNKYKSNAQKPSTPQATLQASAANADALNVQIPALIPKPAVTMAPEDRLIFKKSINNKRGALEHLIFHDSLLNTPCYIAVHNYNIKAQDENRYCIPFSGNEKEITHPMALTQTAKQYENYAYCAPIIKPEKRNIPGLAGFFKAFNPTYYNSNLARFIDNPFQIHKPTRREGNKKEWTNYSYAYVDPTADGCYDSQGDSLSNPFITIHEYQKYQLTPGTVFLTASAAKDEKVLHQYWQIINGQPESVCECTGEGYNYGEDNAGGSYSCDNFAEPIVQVKDLSSKETYEVLMQQIQAGMPARNHYCQAVDNAWLNEARAGNWALVDNNSPLMKKR